jgi:formylglycine-generating enzyme required for sulfatase activity
MVASAHPLDAQSLPRDEAMLTARETASDRQEMRQPEKDDDQKPFENDLGMIFIRVPAGTFRMGSPESEKLRDPDETRHEVRLTRGFYIQSREVTNQQYARFLNAVNSRGPLEEPWLETRGQDEGSRIIATDAGFRPAPGYEDHPAAEISWYGAMAFAEWLSRKTGNQYTLPTEAQWEYACRAGAVSRFSWGNEARCSRMMFANNTEDVEDTEIDRCVPYVVENGMKADAPAPVGSYPANPWGIYDMHGNLWEWVNNWYAEYETIRAVNPTGPAFGNDRVIRGGSWRANAEDCRSANRNHADPATHNSDLGFRLVRNL